MAEKQSRKEKDDEDEDNENLPTSRRLLEKVSFFERIWKGTKIVPSASNTVEEAQEAFEIIDAESSSLVIVLLYWPTY